MSSDSKYKDANHEMGKAADNKAGQAFASFGREVAKQMGNNMDDFIEEGKEFDINAFKRVVNHEYKQNVQKIDKYGTIFDICKLYKYPIEKFVYEKQDNYYNTAFHINGQKGTNAQQNSKNYSR